MKIILTDIKNLNLEKFWLPTHEELHYLTGITKQKSLIESLNI